jgi:hypothetical protein
MLAHAQARGNRENTYGRGAIDGIASRQRRLQLAMPKAAAPYITRERAPTTASMFWLLMAATQIRPESTP